MSTIDPGCEEQLKASAQDMEPDAGEQMLEEQKEERADLMDPSKWWFASTACPLLAGTFGPMANAFSICSLAYCWRVYIPPGGTEEHGTRINDPIWLEAINAVSLLFALVGNLTLLLNMSKRLRFSIAQPLTITGFLTAGVLLIADMAALASSPDYFITEADAIPDAQHALTAAFYYACFAAGIYIVIGLLMCLTVYGANHGHYDKDFNLTPSQRTLMLQTMAFMAYLLCGAAVFSHIEGWNFLVGVYWADITLLTIGLGDYSPATNVGRGLLFPYAICGILIVGLVVGSIRSLVLERGEEKMSARIVEKRRETAVHNVDQRRQTIKISWFARAEFCTDPALSPAQRREEEFTIMRKVQHAAARERRYFSLVMSLTFALLLWFLGAVVFMETEYTQQWTYFESLYFCFTSLLTIGYGDYSPDSNCGRAFFVFWSLLAIPSLTILISNMGDTIVKWFTDATEWAASITVLPGEEGIRASLKKYVQQTAHRSPHTVLKFTPPGLFGDVPNRGIERMNSNDHAELIMDQLASRLLEHVEEDELRRMISAERRGDELERDMAFYHYVLSREIRNVQKDFNASPPKEYSWGEWEYYLKLMGNEDDPEDYGGQRVPDVLVPEALQAPAPIYQTPASHVAATSGTTERPDEARPAPDTLSATAASPASESDATLDGVVDRETEVRESREGNDDGAQKTSQAKDTQRKRRRMLRHPKRTEDEDPLGDWSWLSDMSPLMSHKSESQWILERLSAALERELNRQRKGDKRQPPISMKDMERKIRAVNKQEKEKQARRGDSKKD